MQVMMLMIYVALSFVLHGLALLGWWLKFCEGGATRKDQFYFWLLLLIVITGGCSIYELVTGTH